MNEEEKNYSMLASSLKCVSIVSLTFTDIYIHTKAKTFSNIFRVVLRNSLISNVKGNKYTSELQTSDFFLVW